MNFSKGVIKTPELDNCSPEEIIGNLFSAGVINKPLTRIHTYLHSTTFIYQITLTMDTLVFQYKNIYLCLFAALNVNDLDITFLNADHNILLVQDVINLTTQKIVLLTLL